MKSYQFDFIWEDFKQELYASKYWNLIFNQGYDIIAIFPVGSCLTGCRDENSDIDLMVLVKDTADICEVPNYFLKWKNKKVHWNYQTLRWRDSFNYCLWLMQLQNLNIEDCLYINENFQSSLEQLIKRKEDIVNKSSLLLLYDMKHIVTAALSKGFLPSTHSKLFFHILYSYSRLVNKKYNENEMLAAKRVRWRPFSNELKNFLKQEFLEIENFLNRYSKEKIHLVQQELENLLQLENSL